MVSSKQNLFKGLQVGVNVLIIVLCMCVFIPLGYIQKFLNSSCILNADIFGSLTSNGTTLIIDNERTRMGEPHLCDYTTYAPVVVAIHAFIWSWFFLCVRRSLREDGDETSLLFPVLVLHGILFICLLVSSWIITSGFTGWCHSVETNIVPNKRFSCRQSDDVVWSIFIDKKTHTIYTFFLLAQICSWLVTACLLGQCIISMAVAYHDLPGTSDDQEKQGIMEETSSGNAEHIHDVNVGTGSINVLAPPSSKVTAGVDVHCDFSYQNSCFPETTVINTKP